jgi:hypothetical protein
VAETLNATLVAVDGGPRETLQPIADQHGLHLQAVCEQFAERDDCWVTWLAEKQPQLLVAGTSNSERGRRVESAARRAATRIGMPVAVVEDYAGNYFDLPDCPTRLLVVESAFSERLYRARLAAPPAIAVIPSARYDRWRGKVQHTVVSREPFALLWAGQPETEACVATLEWLLAQLGFTAQLLFRAHPRDPAIHGRTYSDLFASAGVDWLDVSAELLEKTLARRLDLVVTQFSSVAVEAGFAGVPSLHVLLPHAGGRLLRRLKGYEVPGICEAGAAFLATSEQQGSMLRSALLDGTARERVIARFRTLYAADAPTAKLVAMALRAILP